MLEVGSEARCGGVPLPGPVLPALERLGIALQRIATLRRLSLALLFLLWALCNPYYEIDRSSLIYAGRALASLDPTGVGRDIMFVHDGQSQFTAFTVVYRCLAEAFGLTTASMLIAAGAVVASFAGAAVLAGALATGRTRLLAIAFAAALPASYGGYKLFAYAEAAATPRPFAEALVLVGVAALVRGSHGYAVLAMVAAFALHPIMAAPGLAVLAIWLAIADRRILVPIAGLAIAATILAFWHVAPFDRLSTLLDPSWKSVLVARNPQIFPSLWPEGWMGRFAARATTLLVAASLSHGPVRKLCIVTLAVGAGGLLTAYIVNRELPLLLLTQAQLWRSDWLVFSLAAFVGAICVVELWSRRGTSRVALALLVLGWIYADSNTAVVFDLMALAFHFCLRDGTDVLPGRIVTSFCAVAALLVLAGLFWTECGIAASIGTVDRGQFADAHDTFATAWDYTPLALLAAIAIVGDFVPSRRSTLVLLSACGLVLAGSTWDRRSLENRYVDSGQGVGDLRSLIDTRPGEVFWVDGRRETWSWLGRPQWLAAIQGAGLVFSRPLSILYRARADLAIAAGLADDTILAPFAEKPHEPPLVLDAKKVVTFCAAAAAPAWLIVPAGKTPPHGLLSVRWEAPVAKLMPSAEADGSIAWHTVKSYDVIACAR